MVSYTKTHLIISIADAQPNERRDWLIQAIAASMRWSANASDNKTNGDAENQVVLAQLLEELVLIDNS